MNKLKEAEFLYMLEGKFYGGAELLKKKSKIRQNCWTRNVKFVVDIQYNSFNIDRVLSHTTIVLIYLLVCPLG